jgi:SSS family solute:Na+ symporter
MGGLALLPFSLFLASRIRTLAVYTLPDILRQAYGERVAVPAGLMIALAWCGVIAAQLIAGVRLLQALFPLYFQTALAIVAFVFTLYTFWGGQLSVIRTDFWQFMLFVGGLVVALAFLTASGTGIWEDIPRGHFHFPVSEAFGWYEVLLFYPLIVGLPYLVGPDIYSRVLCAKDHEVARRAALGAALIVIPLSFLLAFFGILARGEFPAVAPEAALPETLRLLVPMGLKGLIVAGFLGAVMSSADTCLISASTILTLNVIGPLCKVKKERHLALTRGAVLTLGILSWFMASQKQGIISSLLLGYTIFVGGVVFPTLASFFQDKMRITPSGALWAVVIGGGTAVLGKVQGGLILKAALTPAGQVFLEKALGAHYLSLLPILLSVAAMVGVSRITRPKYQVA